MTVHIVPIRYTFRQITTFICFWASGPLIERFLKNISIKVFGAQNQQPHKLLWMLWFDEKVYLTFMYGERPPVKKTRELYLCDES